MSWLTETWYAVNTLHKESEYGYILVFGMLPRILFMLVGGVVADNYSKKHVIASSLCLRAFLLTILGILMVTKVVNFTTIIAFTFFYGLIDAYYWPSRDAILVEIVERDDLQMPIHYYYSPVS